jgi:hypothetical protein
MRPVEKRRQRVVENLSKLLIGADAGFTPEDNHHFLFVATNFGVTGSVESFLQEFKSDDLRREVMAAMVVCLFNKLKATP